MSDSIVFYLDRNDNLQVIDPDCVPHSDDINPLQQLVIDMINAGYEGVAVDQIRLQDGRYFQAISANLDTPEGQILTNLSEDYLNEKPLPPSQTVLKEIQDSYAVGNNRHQSDC